MLERVAADTGGGAVTVAYLFDLSGLYPGFGYGALDTFNGYVVYRIVGEQALASEIMGMQELIERDYQRLQIDQDLSLSMMLWLSHFFPQEDWAKIQGNRSLAMLGRMWVDPPSYFCRAPPLRHIIFAFTNYSISIGLQAVGRTPDRIARVNQYFDDYRSGDHYRSPTSWHAPLIFRVRSCGRDEKAVSVC